MPYHVLLGLLALWLAPVRVAQAAAELPAPVSSPAPSDEARAAPEDYPEDFSSPVEGSEALENRYAAFGEDEGDEQPAASVQTSAPVPEAGP